MPAAYEAADLQRIFGDIKDRMRAIEEQLAVLSRQAGVPYERPGEEVPPAGTADAAGIELLGVELPFDAAGLSAAVAEILDTVDAVADTVTESVGVYAVVPAALAAAAGLTAYELTRRRQSNPELAPLLDPTPGGGHD